MKVIYINGQNLNLLGIGIAMLICIVPVSLQVYAHRMQPPAELAGFASGTSMTAASNEVKKLRRKRFKQIKGSLEGLMWLLIVIFYFIISFATHAWYITWIIFLGAAVECLLRDFLLLRAREQATSINQETIVQNDISSMTPSNGSITSEDIQPEIPLKEPAPFQAVPAVSAPSCFTYEVPADGTLRITEYDKSKNTDNPYIDGDLTHVATITEYEFRENDSRGIGVRDERLINGEWQIYREEIILLDEDYFTEAYDHAYEQLTYLYVDDGYWDM